MTAIVGGSSGISFPTWTTDTRPSSPVAGTMGWNTDLVSIEVYDGSAWGAVGGGGGASADGTIYVNSNTISSSFSVDAGSYGQSVGKITITDTGLVTLGNTSRWVIS